MLHDLAEVDLEPPPQPVQHQNNGRHREQNSKILLKPIGKNAEEFEVALKQLTAKLKVKYSAGWP